MTWRSSSGVPAGLEVLEVEGLAEFVGAGVQRAAGARHPGLGDRHTGRAVGVEDPAPVAVDLVDLVAVEEGVGAGRHRGRARPRSLSSGAPRSRSGSPRSLARAWATSTRKPSTPRSDQKRRVVRKSARTSSFAQFEVGLLGGEQVQVPLAVRHPLPGAAAEDGLPVGGREFAVCAAAVAEDVAVAGRRAGAGGERLLEPDVLVGGVVGDEVDDHLQAEAVGLGGQGVEVVEGAQAGVDVPVVGDVVAAVGEFGGVEGAQPQGVHAQRGEVVRRRVMPSQVAEAVAVGVGEAAGVDLVDDGLPPPVGVPGGEVGGRGGVVRGKGRSGRDSGRSRGGLPHGDRDVGQRQSGFCPALSGKRTRTPSGAVHSPCDGIVMTS